MGERINSANGERTVTRWHRHVQRMPDGTYIDWRNGRHYAGEQAEIVALVLRYSA